MSTKFFRAFVLPSKVDLGVSDVVFRFSNLPGDTSPALFVESVSVGSGPIDAPLAFEGNPNIFVKRARLFLPYVSGSYPMISYALETSALEIANYANARALASFPDNPLRIRAEGNHAFRANDWIDCNSFLKLDPLNLASAPLANIAINSVEVGVIFGAPIGTFNLSGARLEIEFHSNMETKR